MGSEDTLRVPDRTMKYIIDMIQKISRTIMSIFFDISTYGEQTRDIYRPQDLTEHYHQELNDSELD